MDTYSEPAALPIPPPPHQQLKRSRDGLIGIVIAFLLKGAKLLSVAKAALAVASFGLYSAIFTWQFALLIMVSLFVHESGHIWAMKRLGMKTRGIYFIPFLGGAAVADAEFPSRRGEVFVAIMGPIWGFALAGITAGAYFLTDQPIWAAAAGWMAFINLFNLFPVNPLDGGRIVKSVAFSLNSWLGIGAMGAGFLAALYFCFQFGFGLLIFIVLLGGMEFIGEIRGRQKRGDRIPRMNIKENAASMVSYVALAAALLWMMLAMQHEPGANLAMHFLSA